MIEVTYETYSPILDKSFTQVESFRCYDDFRLRAIALYSANWTVISVVELSD